MNNEEYLFESEYGFSYSVTPYIDTYANNDNLYLGFYTILVLEAVDRRRNTSLA